MFPCYSRTPPRRSDPVSFREPDPVSSRSRGGGGYEFGGSGSDDKKNKQKEYQEELKRQVTFTFCTYMIIMFVIKLFTDRIEHFLLEMEKIH